MAKNTKPLKVESLSSHELLMLYVDLGPAMAKRINELDAEIVRLETELKAVKQGYYYDTH